MTRYKCDHCDWQGAEADQLPHPRLGYSVCPWCWEDGYETCPRALWGPLMEACLEPEPTPRVRKPLIDWTEEEFETAARIQRAKAAHETSLVRLKTRVKGAAQIGFGFMREEFRVMPKERRRK
jgi:hypothetical protein